MLYSFATNQIIFEHPKSQWSTDISERKLASYKILSNDVYYRCLYISSFFNRRTLIWTAYTPLPDESCVMNFGRTLNSSAAIVKFISVAYIVYVQQSITWCVQINKFVQRFNTSPKDICFKFCYSILKLIKNKLFAFVCSEKARRSARKLEKILASMRLKNLVWMCTKISIWITSNCSEIPLVQLRAVCYDGPCLMDPETGVIISG